MTTTASGPLSGLRILDLTTERSWLTGRILADLGATVTKLEPPGGDPARLDPRAHREPVGVRTTTTNPRWIAYNRGKRSATVALDRPEGRDLVRRLASQAHALLESHEVGTLTSWGLARDDLAAANPALVVTSVSAFGQTGPYAAYAATDLIVAALGGAVWPNGDPDRPPVRISSDQSFLHAAAEAAVHTIVALKHAARTGVGQHIDVSAQLATVRTLMNAVAGPITDGSVVTRTTFGEPAPLQPHRALYACRDGHVLALVGFRTGAGGFVQWLRDEGAATAELDRLAPPRDGAAAFADESPELVAAVDDALAAFFSQATMKHLTDEALRRRLVLAPLNTVADLTGDEHLLARDFFHRIPLDDSGDTARVPAFWARLSASPLTPTGGVPAVGQHNQVTWVEEAGLAPAQLLALERGGVI